MLLLAAGDMCSMDVLVAEAKVIKYPVDDVKGGSGSKMKMWQGMEESLAKFYVASIVLALEYLHDQNLVSIYEGRLQHAQQEHEAWLAS